MDLKPSLGIGDIRFGMTELEIIAILGNPDAIVYDPHDTDKNTVYQYNQLKLRLTFYTTENNRLLYLRTSHPETTLYGFPLIDQELHVVFAQIKTSKLEWEEEVYFSFNAYFNEDRWIMFHTEYERINQVEMGATFIDETDL